MHLLELAGAAERSYRFPAPPAEAYAFHRDLARTIGWLPHIAVEAALGAGRWRLAYRATEAGWVDVEIVCEVRAWLDEPARTIRIVPLPGPAAVRGTAGRASMRGQGRYESESRFEPDGGVTRVTTRLALGASLPVARALRWLPAPVLDAAARRIVQARTEEILRGFAERSVAAYTAGG